jgi:cytochrome c-type biogenesis protein CcmE
MMNKEAKISLAALATLIFLGYLIFTCISDTRVYYRTVSEVLGQASILERQSLRVRGEVVDGTVQYDLDNPSLSFAVRDTKNNRLTMWARYRGVMPDAFKEDVAVFLEGTYSQYDNLFSATTLLVKCPSKYVAETES